MHGLKMLLVFGMIFAISTIMETTSDPECGTRSVPPKRPTSSRILSGEEVNPHSIPWQVEVTIKGDRGYCGGTLISPVHVLTAAHCLDRVTSEYSVWIGQHKTNPRDGTRIKVCHISPWKNFTLRTIDNDFGIIHLSTPVRMSKEVRIACLPDESMGGNFLEGKRLTVSGWGRGSEDVLKRVQYQGRSNGYCQSLHNNRTITENMVCAGNPYPHEKAHCSGDSGGPLTYNNNGRETVVGIVSWNVKRNWNDCANPGKIDVYARVTAQLNWIKKIMHTKFDGCQN